MRALLILLVLGLPAWAQETEIFSDIDGVLVRAYNWRKGDIDKDTPRIRDRSPHTQFILEGGKRVVDVFLSPDAPLLKEFRLNLMTGARSEYAHAVRNWLIGLGFTVDSVYSREDFIKRTQTISNQRTILLEDHHRSDEVAGWKERALTRNRFIQVDSFLSDYSSENHAQRFPYSTLHLEQFQQSVTIQNATKQIRRELNPSPLRRMGMKISDLVYSHQLRSHPLVRLGVRLIPIRPIRSVREGISSRLNRLLPQPRARIRR